MRIEKVTNSYISIVIVGKSEANLAWPWRTWSVIIPWLDPILSATREGVGVRSVQGVRVTHKDVRFGQLGWDTKSHKKWSHLSEVNKEESGNWVFCFTEIWAPRWTVCARERRDPLVFMNVTNPFLLAPAKPGQFNQFFQLSTTSTFFNQQRVIIDSALQNISALLESALIIFRVSPWNQNFDSVQSALNNHLEYLGMPDDLVPDLSKTTGKWSDYHPNCDIDLPTKLG
jgi:hypothetical protein